MPNAEWGSRSKIHLIELSGVSCANVHNVRLVHSSRRIRARFRFSIRCLPELASFCIFPPAGFFARGRVAPPARNWLRFAVQRLGRPTTRGDPELGSFCRAASGAAGSPRWGSISRCGIRCVSSNWRPGSRRNWVCFAVRNSGWSGPAVRGMPGAVSGRDSRIARRPRSGAVDLPSGVRGPVAAWAFMRFARICAAVDMTP